MSLPISDSFMAEMVELLGRLYYIYIIPSGKCQRLPFNIIGSLKLQLGMSLFFVFTHTKMSLYKMYIVTVKKVYM